MPSKDPHQSRALLDVDGTCTVGPGKHPNEFAPLNTGVRAFLGALKDRGLEVIVFSARSPVEAVKQFFKREGLDRYVDGFTRTKLPARFIIDDRVVKFRGDYGQTLAEVDSFLPWWDKPNKYSCAMMDLPEEICGKIKEIASKIDPEDLHPDGKESAPHITLLWGISGNDSSGVRRALFGKKPAQVTFGKLSLFENEEQDVLKVGADSPDLHALNAAIKREAPHVETHPQYIPHATVAYLKPGKGKKYLDLPGIEGSVASLDSVTFSGRNNSKQTIRIG